MLVSRPTPEKAQAAITAGYWVVFMFRYDPVDEMHNGAAHSDGPTRSPRKR